MATKFEIAEQVALERECIRCGIDKLHKNTRNVEEREYASASVYGVSSIRAAQEHIGQRIQERFSLITERQVGRACAAVKRYLLQCGNNFKADVVELVQPTYYSSEQ